MCLGYCVSYVVSHCQLSVLVWVTPTPKTWTLASMDFERWPFQALNCELWPLSITGINYVFCLPVILCSHVYWILSGRNTLCYVSLLFHLRINSLFRPARPYKSLDMTVYVPARRALTLCWRLKDRPVAKDDTEYVVIVPLMTNVGLYCVVGWSPFVRTRTRIRARKHDHFHCNSLLPFFTITNFIQLQPLCRPWNFCLIEFKHNQGFKVPLEPCLYIDHAVTQFHTLHTSHSHCCFYFMLGLAMIPVYVTDRLLSFYCQMVMISDNPASDCNGSAM